MQWDIFINRLREHFPPLLERLVHLYGTRIDFFYHLEELGAILADAWFTRPVVLKKPGRRPRARPALVSVQPDVQAASAMWICLPLTCKVSAKKFRTFRNSGSLIYI